MICSTCYITLLEYFPFYFPLSLYDLNMTHNNPSFHFVFHVLFHLILQHWLVTFTYTFRNATFVSAGRTRSFMLVHFVGIKLRYNIL